MTGATITLFRFALVAIVPMMFLSGCCLGSKDMSDADFSKITMAYGMAMAVEILQPENRQLSESEWEDKAYEILDKACKRYGYSRRDYECKAKQVGKDLEQMIRGGTSLNTK